MATSLTDRTDVLTILTCRRSGSREPEPSIINEKAIADFRRVVEQTGILDGGPIVNEKPGSKAGLIASIY
jgi:hypothetical protein